MNPDESHLISEIDTVFVSACAWLDLARSADTAGLLLADSAAVLCTGILPNNIFDRDHICGTAGIAVRTKRNLLNGG